VALGGVAKDLISLRFRIGKVFEDKVHMVLIDDLRRHVRSVETEELLFRWETASLRAKGDRTQELLGFPSYMDKTDE
jgi:vacuolar protein sorting-associated protein 54